VRGMDRSELSAAPAVNAGYAGSSYAVDVGALVGDAEESAELDPTDDLLSQLTTNRIKRRTLL